MRIQYTLIPREQREDKICKSCNTNKSVKYLHKEEYYCNVCMLKLITTKL